MNYLRIYLIHCRFMGALTSLLVLASLLASIEENLPKTRSYYTLFIIYVNKFLYPSKLSSYFKKIDVWFMSYIIFIFIIIVFHICVDFWIKHDDQVKKMRIWALKFLNIRLYILWTGHWKLSHTHNGKKEKIVCNLPQQHWKNYFPNMLNCFYSHLLRVVVYLKKLLILCFVKKKVESMSNMMVQYWNMS